MINDTNNTISICVTEAKDTVHLTTFQLAVIFTITIIVLIGNIILNTIVIYCLLKTKQTGNASCKMMLQLSLTDVFVGYITRPLFIVVTGFPKSPCVLKILSQFFGYMLSRVSVYTIALIGVDRYVSTYQVCNTYQVCDNLSRDIIP